MTVALWFRKDLHFCVHINYVRRTEHAVFVSSNMPDKFSCAHTKKCKEAANVECVYDISPEMIENYQGDCSTKELLLSVYDSRQPGCPIVCNVSDLSYVVLGLPCTNNPLGYAHVKNNKTGLFCCSKDSECNAFAPKGKYERARKFCSHLHALFCVGVSVSTDNPTCTETPQESQPS